MEFLIKKKDFLIIIFLAIVSAFLRFFLIDIIPCGLFPDQAIHGLDAIRFSNGLLSPVFSGGNEGLFIYLVALSHAIFGTGVWQIFIVSAFIGSITVITTYLAVKEIFDRKIAFLSCFFLAVSSWHIALSRSGFRAILVPFVISLFAFFLAKAIKAKNKKEKSVYYPLAAAIFALGFYTYNAYPVFAFAFFLISIFLLIKNHKKLKPFITENKKEILSALIAFIIVILPIALFIIIFPNKYFIRVENISIFSGGKTALETLKLFVKNYWEAFMGVFQHGDFNWRHNAAGKPLLDAFLVPFFGITFIYAIIKEQKLLILFFLFFMMFLPTALTNEGIQPHGLRLIGIIPMLFIIPSISLSWLLKFKTKIAKMGGLIIIMLTF